MARDIVCDRLVDEVEAADGKLISYYEDQSFYFCSKRCKAMFDLHPEKWGKRKPVELYTGHQAMPIDVPPPQTHAG